MRALKIPPRSQFLSNQDYSEAKLIVNLINLLRKAGCNKDAAIEALGPHWFAKWIDDNWGVQ